jgi:hypothetical protein
LFAIPRSALTLDAVEKRFILDMAMKTPAEVYSASPRPYQGLPEISYPWHDRDVVVTACGRICMHRKRINLSHSVSRRSTKAFGS